MRDPKRIEEMLALINQIWNKQPDLRFNQLLCILQNGYSKENNGIGRVENNDQIGFTQVGYDFFSVEDDTFLEYLKAIDKKGF